MCGVTFITLATYIEYSTLICMSSGISILAIHIKKKYGRNNFSISHRPDHSIAKTPFTHFTSQVDDFLFSQHAAELT